ncbi:MAG: hypothetical protein J2O47_02950 [Acidimicrobiaceae bacterium]|nr:hypothetical protein [Acidimicrobiaceae bacterium]
MTETPGIELVFFPDVEAALVATLRPILDVPVVTRVPNPRPPRFVRLIRVGGGRANRITDSPMVTFEAWADPKTGGGDVAAFELARTARAHINGLAGSWAGGVWVRRVVDIAGPPSYPDPETGTSRYQMTLQLDVRGTPG